MNDVWIPILPSHSVISGQVSLGFFDAKELALWRSTDGRAQAWANRCPHRGVRFTLGHVIGDNLVCGYHGWQYAAESGRCSFVPAHPKQEAPKNVCATVFSVAEHSGMVWVSSLGAASSPPGATEGYGAFCSSVAIPRDLDVVAENLRKWEFEESNGAWIASAADMMVYLTPMPEGKTLAHVWAADGATVEIRQRMVHVAQWLRNDIESLSTSTY